MFTQLKVQVLKIYTVLEKSGLLVKCLVSVLSGGTACKPKQKTYGDISCRHVVKISTVM